MANFLITEDEQGINLDLLEHFEKDSGDIIFHVAGNKYTVTPREETSIEKLGEIIYKAKRANIPVVRWDKIVGPSDKDNQNRNRGEPSALRRSTEI